MQIIKRKNVILFLRFIILCLLIFPSVSFVTPPAQQVVICLDFSRSIKWLHNKNNLSLQDVYQQELQKITQALSPQDQYAIVCFATQATIAKKFTENKTVFLEYNGDIETSRVDLALQSAMTMFHTHSALRKTIIVYSDGLVKDLPPRIQKQLTYNNITLRFEYLQTQQIKQLRDIAIRKLTLPSFAKQGQTLHGEIVVKTSHKTEAMIQLRNDDTTIEQRSIYLPKQGEYTFHFFFNVNDKRDMNITAQVYSLSFDDPCLQNNIYHQNVHVEKKSQILEFGTQLRQLNVDFATITSYSDHTSFDEIDLQDYDVVVISDMAFTKLQRFDNLIAQHIANGHGLMMIASPKTFALGGYSNTNIEKSLPVWTTPRQKNSQHIVVLLDISGSMNEKYSTTTKIEAAKQAILEINDQLNGETLELIAFNNNIYDIFSQKTADINSKIATLRANGETKIVPALRYTLQKKPQQKHIIIISDGEVQKNIMNQLGTLPKNTSLSVISTGKNNSILQKIARWGKGNFYDANSMALREIIWRDLLETKGTLLIEKNTMVVRKSHAIKNWSWEDYTGKYIGKYVLTKAKSSAKTLIQTPSGDALLCVANYQLGRCVALMTNTSWTKDLAVEKLIAQALQWLTSIGNSPYKIFIDHHKNKIRIRYHVDKHNQQIFVRPQWLQQRFTMREREHGIYTLELPMPKKSITSNLSVQYNDIHLPVKFHLVYSPEYVNLTDVNYIASTKNSNKNSNSVKNMDNILICFAVICFLLERFLNKGIQNGF
ncbi:VWA domain-containing protein [Candidatus Uabimicrobium amorphum]|uniref:VWA domain-containing protein n=1 Tax=Uabimicrobium amorphum TaxID=2596890 RepID=A0A5S9F1S7_UABAM|nr:VWA domain-containing protein [Candidatus Uabimicrobium amorphum]BBM82927.1 VWA domain-containing protein [Candidatus Uabimicrobium amorphum]